LWDIVEFRSLFCTSLVKIKVTDGFDYMKLDSMLSLRDSFFCPFHKDKKIAGASPSKEQYNDV
jgi:hypothetical protein